MATCNHCGYKNAVDGQYCPNCGNKVQDNTLAYIAIVAIIIILLALILGPAYLLFKAYKTRQEPITNWWLVASVFTSITAIILAPYFAGEHPDWQWFKATVTYVNWAIFIGSLVMLFLRLKNYQYQFTKLFNTKNDKNE
ncbi:MAG: hypothetical protein H6599_02035 [Flavobacteriales bacterium]|nr:hypothetical protein [Flavobacteriales bacterium]